MHNRAHVLVTALFGQTLEANNIIKETERRQVADYVARRGLLLTTVITNESLEDSRPSSSCMYLRLLTCNTFRFDHTLPLWTAFDGRDE